jgi:hypothetical protein
MGKYREPPASLDKIIADLTARVAKLERTPRGTNTTIDKGNFDINGGTLSVWAKTPAGGGQNNPIFTATGKPLDIDKIYVLDSMLRTVTNGWGIADTGQTWAVLGTATDYAVATGIGTQSLGSVNVRRGATVGVAVSGSTQILSVKCPVIATGAPISAGAFIHYNDSNNYYTAEVVFNVDGTLSLEISRMYGGILTSLGTATTGIIYTATKTVNIATKIDSGIISISTWLADPNSFEPSNYQLNVSDNSIATGLQGITSILRTGNTNTTPVIMSFPLGTGVGKVYQIFVYNNATGLSTFNAINTVTMSRINSAATSFNIPFFEFNDAPIDPTIPAQSLMIAFALAA